MSSLGVGYRRKLNETELEERERKGEAFRKIL